MHFTAAYTRKLLTSMEPIWPLNLIYQNTEDDLGDTVKPQLLEAGTDIERLAINDSEKQPTLSE